MYNDHGGKMRDYQNITPKKGAKSRHFRLTSFQLSRSRQLPCYVNCSGAEEITGSFFYKASTILIPKPDKSGTKNKMTGYE